MKECEEEKKGTRVGKRAERAEMGKREYESMK